MGTELWYAVFCKPRQETVAAENLLRQNYHAHLPRIEVSHRRRGRWLDVVEPLFPRYIFIRMDPARRSTAPLRSTRGVVGLVRFGGEPAVVPDTVMDALLKRADLATGIHPDQRRPYCAGDVIRMVEGPLTGVEGIWRDQDGDKRVIVLLEILGKANRIKVSRDWIARAA